MLVSKNQNQYASEILLYQKDQFGLFETLHVFMYLWYFCTLLSVYWTDMFLYAAQESSVFLCNKRLRWDRDSCCGNIYRCIKLPPHTLSSSPICTGSPKCTYKQLERSQEGVCEWVVTSKTQLRVAVTFID